MTNGTILIGGPTASGKSALALELAAALEESGGATIINADSMQVYSELRIVTDRPTPADEARVPHALYGVLAGSDACSAGRWQRMAVDCISDVQAAGRTAIVVGGTGLYLKALTKGLAEIPDIPDDIRQAARQAMATKGPEQFHQDLAAVDPGAAAAIAPGDRQRAIRALEVWQATGRSVLNWQAAGQSGGGLTGPTAKVVVMPDREGVYARAEARIAAIVARGVIDEIKALDALGLDPDLPVMRAVGVPEFLAVVRGETAVDEAVAAAAQASRRFAKRQFTWFRHQTPDWRVFSSPGGARIPKINAQQSESFFAEVFPFIRQTLLTKGVLNGYVGAAFGLGGGPG